MERKIWLMKLTGLAVFFISLGIALFLSNMDTFMRWACAAVFAVATVSLFLKRNNMKNVDEREMYIEHVAGWLAGVLTLTAANIFIIVDVVRNGHYDNRLLGLICIWGVAKALVTIAMGGGRGTIGEQA